MIHRDYLKRVSGLDIPRRFAAMGQVFLFPSCNQHIFPRNAGHPDLVLSSDCWTGFVGMFDLSLGGIPPDWCGSNAGRFAAGVLVSPNKPTSPIYPDLPLIKERKTIFFSRLLYIRTHPEHTVLLLRHPTLRPRL